MNIPYIPYGTNITIHWVCNILSSIASVFSEVRTGRNWVFKVPVQCHIVLIPYYSKSVHTPSITLVLNVHLVTKYSVGSYVGD